MTYPFDREGPLDMPPEFAWLRDNAPVTPVTLPSGDTAWLVTRYEDCRRVLSDWRFSRDLSRPGTARVNPAIGFGNYGNPFADPPEHTRWRSQVAKAFTARQIEAMRPRITAVVEDLVGEMTEQGPPAELMQALAYPLPITMMCQTITW